MNLAQSLRNLGLLTRLPVKVMIQGCHPDQCQPHETSAKPLVGQTITDLKAAERQTCRTARSKCTSANLLRDSENAASLKSTSAPLSESVKLSTKKRVRCESSTISAQISVS